MNTNDELRQKFVDETVPQAEYLGLNVPDENLKFNEETGHYEFTQPDWDEFYDVLKDAMMAHAEKKAARKQAAE